jgi:hypothetical protein
MNHVQYARDRLARTSCLLLAREGVLQDRPSRGMAKAARVRGKPRRLVPSAISRRAEEQVRPLSRRVVRLKWGN